MTDGRDFSPEPEINEHQKLAFIERVTALLPPPIPHEDLYEDEVLGPIQVVDIRSSATYHVGSTAVHLVRHNADKIEPQLIPEFFEVSLVDPITTVSDQMPELIRHYGIERLGAAIDGRPARVGRARYHESTPSLSNKIPMNEYSDEEIRAHILSMSEIAQQEEMLGLNKLTARKYQALMEVLGQCGPRNLVAIGKGDEWSND